MSMTEDKKNMLKELIDQGKKAGKLNAKAILNIVEELSLDSDQIDKLYDTLEALSIEIAVDVEYIEEIDEDGPADDEEVEEIPVDELAEADNIADSVSIDDPVRMYLKEIGKVDLLTPEGRLNWQRGWRQGTKRLNVNSLRLTCASLSALPRDMSVGNALS